MAESNKNMDIIVYFYNLNNSNLHKYLIEFLLIAKLFTNVQFVESDTEDIIYLLPKQKKYIFLEFRMIWKSP